ncbi:MAG: hypothetical protein DHS20C13_13850 [Thermodesulfobacteriota bacterium]|nr:MAG: hypothetical protein DHS20C13_13850 [Thermodesulfobacteriota bacterium]
MGRLLSVGLILLCFTSFALSEEEFKLGPPNQDRPVEVKAHFELHDINEINDEADTFEFSGVLTLKWVDPRAAFDPALAGVDERIFQGAYQFNEVATGWYPQLFLINESGLYEINGVTLRILPDGTSTLIQTINATAEVRLDMRKFPFDKQRLDAIFQVLGFDNGEVLLHQESDSTEPVEILFPIPQWTISSLTQSVRDFPSYYAGTKGISSTFVLSVDVKRKPFYLIRLVVIPLIVIVLLSFTVFWMDKSSLGDRLNVSFIGILTGVAYLLVTSDHLPNISYFTLIHGFLNLSYLTMCATVVINLIVGSLDKQGKSKAGDRVDQVCRWAFPIVYFGLLIIMFVIADLTF